MKRANLQEEKCRRMEFKCKLYDLIKELDRSLKSECGRSNLPPGRDVGMNTFKGHPGKERKQKGAECCCPPGCCQESMEFRMPKLLPQDPPSPREALMGSEDPQGVGTGYLGWHNEDHSWGCRPVGEGGPGSQSSVNTPAGGSAGCNPYSSGVAGANFAGGSPGCGGGSPDVGGGCCTYIPKGSANPEPPHKTFQFPQSPEEAIQRGCFVARSA